MATHSGVLAWRIPGTGEPGGLLSLGLHRVGHDWSDLAAAALERKAMTNLDNILKSRSVNKGVYSQSYVFPVVIYGCESWTTKTENQRIDAFELWCWKRLLRVPCTAGRSNQSILKKINPEYSLEGLTEAEAPILSLPDVKSRLFRKYPDAGQDLRQEENGMVEDEMVGWHHWLNGHEF